MVLVDDPWCLDARVSISDETLAIFFCTVAYGKPVLARRFWPMCKPKLPPETQVVHFLPAAFGERVQKRGFRIAKSLERTFPKLCAVVKSVLRAPSSKWTVVGTGAASSSTVEQVRFDSMSDVRQFLFRARRIQHSGSGQLGGHYFSG
jgi:hypothetical protein